MLCLNKVLAGLALAAVTPSLAPAQAREFQIDAGHSDVEFSIPFLGSKVRGRFDGLQATIFFDARDPVRSSITLVIDMASLNSGSRHRDEHLKSADFFDVATYPVALFQSTRVIRRADGLAVSGRLTLHGVTQDLVIPFHPVHPPATDPHGSTLIAFAGAVRLAHKDFAIDAASTFNPWFDRIRRATMGDSVDVRIEVAGWDTDFDRASLPEIDAAIARLDAIGVDALLREARGRLAASPGAFEGQEYNLGLVARKLTFGGRHRDAVALASFVAEAFSQSAAAQAALGTAQEAAGDSTAARAAYQRALGLNATQPRAMERLRRVETGASPRSGGSSSAPAATATTPGRSRFINRRSARTGPAHGRVLAPRSSCFMAHLIGTRAAMRLA